MTDNNNVAAATTARGLAKAHEIYRGDWDADGTTAVYLPDAIAQQLLYARGWTRANGAWHAPTGERIWDIGEALQLALTADVADPTPPPLNA
jgi:hypothetical protein